MRNVHSPLDHEFVLTNKKKRMIKSCMYNFLQSNIYNVFRDKSYITDVDEFISFMEQRLVFLRNVSKVYYIQQTNFNWSGLVIHIKGERLSMDFEIFNSL